MQFSEIFSTVTIPGGTAATFCLFILLPIRWSGTSYILVMFLGWL